LTLLECSWLVVFDNADDESILRPAFPVSTQGAILLTTRAIGVASRLANRSIAVQPFDSNSGTDVFLRLVDSHADDESSLRQASVINSAFGGLPLALSQISSFINHRKMPLGDFMTIYEKNSTRIDAKKLGMGDYEHTLNTVWIPSFEKLSFESDKLLRLLSFFNPDAIHEQILIEGSKAVTAANFLFLQDEME
jgi:NB-ARC domain